MQAATLGGLIKDYRLRKRLSQLEVSLKIGWSDATRLSKIEQGRVGKPSRKTLEKIMDALDLDAHQRGEMLRVGGGIPTYEESKKILPYLKELTEQFRYPVLIVDIYWNTYFVNNQFAKLWNIPDEGINFINENFPNWMYLLFLTNYLGSKNVWGGYKDNNLSPFLEYQIAHFKYELKEYFSEMWFQKLLQKLKSNDEFKDLWTKIDPIETNDHRWYEYEFNRFVTPQGDLNFHVFSIHPTFDSRFYLMTHMPADSTTSKKFEVQLI